MKIVLTPEWFLGKDVMIEFFSFVILALFFFLAMKSYKLSKNKGIFQLSLGFGLISLAQLARVFTKLILYYDIGPSQAIGEAIIASQIVSSVDIFYYAGFFLHGFLTLMGLYLIYKIPKKGRDFGDYVLTTYFLLVVSLLSKNFYYLFYLTSFFLIFLIIKNYIQIYKKNKFINTRLLLCAFSILAFAQLVYIFSSKGIFFAIANTIELISYLILLFLIVRILKYGKKTGTNGNNIGYVGNNSRKKLRN